MLSSVDQLLGHVDHVDQQPPSDVNCSWSLSSLGCQYCNTSSQCRGGAGHCKHISRVSRRLQSG